MGSEVVQNLVAATVTSVELAHIDVQAASGVVRTTEEPVLLVHLTLDNRGQVPVRYDAGEATTTASQARTPLLFVDNGPDADLGQNVPLVTLSSNHYVPDPVRDVVTVAPAQRIEDILIFQAPPEGTNALRLSLPPTMFGPTAEMPVWITIPYAANAPRQPEVGAVMAPVPGDGYSFQVDRYEVAYLPNADASGFTDEPKLAVWFTVANTGETPLQYEPPFTNTGTGVMPALIDRTTYLSGAERSFPLAVLPPGQSLQGQVTQTRVIPPGGSLSDLVAFRRPDAEARELLLYFPGHLVGRTGQVRVGMSYAFSDPPLPAALRGSSASPCASPSSAPELPSPRPLAGRPLPGSAPSAPPCSWTAAPARSRSWSQRVVRSRPSTRWS
jgi:hypothetical protein